MKPKAQLACIGPTEWLLFGFFGFPSTCLLAEFLEWLAMAQLGLVFKSLPSFGWGAAPGLFLGVPFGISSALSAYCWRRELWQVARGIAALSGITIGGIWLSWMFQLAPIAWLGDFGFAITPLIWAGALVLFGVLARAPRSKS